MLTVHLFALLTLGPEAAIERAAAIVGRPDIAPVLRAICQRESRCNPNVGIHLADARPAASSYAGQVQLGHLDRSCQPKGDWRRWGTRGLFGMNAADAWPYMADSCYPPEAMDWPIISSLAAARMYLDRCDGKKTSRWCGRR